MEWPTLAPQEEAEWLERKLRPTQTKLDSLLFRVHLSSFDSVLAVLRQWVEKHWMFIDDPQLLPRLRAFLASIKPPSVHVQTATQLLQIMERQVSGALEFCNW
jgi:hypothetical protein